MKLTIETGQADGRTIVKAEGEVDTSTSPKLRSALLETIPVDGTALGVELAGVTYMDSSGVATLIEGMRACARKGVDYIIMAPSKQVHDVLKLTKLNTVFRIEDRSKTAKSKYR